MKPKVAIFDFASCEGCELQIVNLEEKVIDLVEAFDVVSFREAMKEHSNEYDVAFVEGSIERPMDEARIKEIRARAKILIALGDCACNGCVTKLRNDMPVKDAKREVYGNANTEGNKLFDMLPKAKSLDEVVNVDFYIRGCPVRKEQVLYYVQRFGRIPPHKNLEVRFKITPKMDPVDEKSLVSYNPQKCILCRRCDVMCRANLGIDALGLVGKGPETTISTPHKMGFDKNGCIQCGQCVSACSVGALEAKSDTKALAESLRVGKKKFSVAVDSIALVSLVEKYPGLAAIAPKDAEAFIIGALRNAGFGKVVQYEHYLNRSLELDAKGCESERPMMLSWCKGAFNYAGAKLGSAVEAFEENSPWKLMLSEMGGASENVCLISPCTALKGVNGFAYVLSAMEVDDLFKNLEIDPEFETSAKNTYDNSSARLAHPGASDAAKAAVDGALVSHNITKAVAKQVKEAAKNGTPYVEIYPCLERCLNGGGNCPTVDAEEIKKRKAWLNTLWGAN